MAVGTCMSTSKALLYSFITFYLQAELLRGLYKLMAVSDKYRLAALNAALPAGVKDTFKVMHQEFNKYHRYAGAV